MAGGDRLRPAEDALDEVRDGLRAARGPVVGRRFDDLPPLSATVDHHAGAAGHGGVRPALQILRLAAGDPDHAVARDQFHEVVEGLPGRVEGGVDHPHPALLELHDDAAGLLAAPSRIIGVEPGGDRAHFAHELARGVETVRARIDEQSAAAEIRVVPPAAVHVAAGQTGAVQVRAADGPGCDQVAHHAVRLVEEQVVAHHQAELRRLRRRDHAVALRERKRHRLLHQDVHPGRQRPQHRLAVELVGHADDERVRRLRARPEEGLGIGEPADRVRLRDPGNQRGVEVDDRAEAGGPQARKARQMLLALCAEADDPDPDRFVHVSPAMGRFPSAIAGPRTPPGSRAPVPASGAVAPAMRRRPPIGTGPPPAPPAPRITPSPRRR